jgi:hypothetical protein
MSTRAIPVDIRKLFGQAGVDAWRAICVELGLPLISFQADGLHADEMTALLVRSAVQYRLESTRPSEDTDELPV